MAAKKLEWVFPQKKLFLMRIEIFFLVVLTLTVFVFSYFQFELVRYAVLFTGIFICVYILLSVAVQLVRDVEVKYHLNPQHFKVIRKTRSKTREEKIPLKEFRHHKLDRFFLGGYIFSKKSKHLVFFNTKEELKKFEEFLERYGKKSKK